MPPAASEGAFAGVSGLVVVRARRTSTTPARAIRTPVSAARIAAGVRPGSARFNAGSSHAMAHIRQAVTATTSKGCTLSSRNEKFISLAKRQNCRWRSGFRTRRELRGGEVPDAPEREIRQFEVDGLFRKTGKPCALQIFKFRILVLYLNSLTPDRNPLQG